MSLAKSDPIFRELSYTLKFLDDLNGRDKVTKAVQYALKACIDFSETHNVVHNINTSGTAKLATVSPSHWNKKFNSAHNQLSAARKVFRIFKFLSIYPALIKIVDRFTSSMSDGSSMNWSLKESLDTGADLKSIFMGLYLFYDTVNWAGKAELLPQDERSWWRFSQSTYKDKMRGGFLCWMYSTMLGVLMDIIKLKLWYDAFNIQVKQIIKDEMAKNEERLNTSTEGASSNAQNGVANNKLQIKSQIVVYARQVAFHNMKQEFYKILRALTKDTCDVLVSSHYSGYWSPRQRWIGLFGTISSICAAWDIYFASRK